MRTSRPRPRARRLWPVACGGGGGDDPCAIPPAGDGFLVFADDRSGNYEIRAIKVDGSCDQLVGSSPTDDLAPSWSAAAGLVTWSGAQAGVGRIIVKDLRSGVERALDTGPGVATSPAISPDGTLVAFERRAEGAPNADVYVVAAGAGAAPALLAEGFKADTSLANDAGPVFSVSPAGTFVYFVSDRSGQAEVWRVPVAADGAPTAEPEQLTTGSGLVGRPSVAPDGRSFVYARVVDATGSSIISHVVTTGAEAVVSNDWDSEPALPASGGQLVVKTSRYGRADLVILDAASGALVKRLTSGDHSVGAPAFPR